MRQSGRKSSASNVIPVEFRSPPAAPPGLSPRECEVWRDVVASKPVDWWDAAALDILRHYCRAVLESERIWKLLEAFHSADLDTLEGIKRYERITGWQERQLRILLSCATKLRITQQSRYTPARAATEAGKAGGVRPWNGSGPKR